MYYWLRSLDVKGGKGREARQWAMALEKLLNEKDPAHTCHACMELFGATGRIYAVTTFPSLAELEQSRDMINADEAYIALAAEAAEYFVDASRHDTLLQTI